MDNKTHMEEAGSTPNKERKRTKQLDAVGRVREASKPQINEKIFWALTPIALLITRGKARGLPKTIQNIAKRFKLRYEGPQEGRQGILGHMFTDSKTKSSFTVRGTDPNYKDVGKGLKELRRRYAPVKDTGSEVSHRPKIVDLATTKKAKQSKGLITLINQIKTGQWGDQREAPKKWYDHMIDLHTKLMKEAKDKGNLEEYARQKASLEAIPMFWRPKK